MDTKGGAIVTSDHCCPREEVEGWSGVGMVNRSNGMYLFFFFFLCERACANGHGGWCHCCGTVIVTIIVAWHCHHCMHCVGAIVPWSSPSLLCNVILHHRCV